MELKKVIEALLFSAPNPLNLNQIQSAFADEDRPEKQAIRAAIETIREEYRERPIELAEVASGYRFQVRREWSPWVARLLAEKPPRYSRALLETLAIIAYKQPVTRGDIEEIRGVSVSSNIVHTLLEREWIRSVGHKEVPGRPSLYATTRQFLDYFNLKSLAELPTLEEIRNLEEPVKLAEQPVEESIEETSQTTAESETAD